MIPDANDGRGGYCPRRTVLDHLLVTAAAESGAEMREGFRVDDVLVSDDAVVGIRGHSKWMTGIEERARIVIGADGVDSYVADAVRAPKYDVHPITVLTSAGSISRSRRATNTQSTPGGSSAPFPVSTSSGFYSSIRSARRCCAEWVATPSISLMTSRRRNRNEHESACSKGFDSRDVSSR